MSVLPIALRAAAGKASPTRQKLRHTRKSRASARISSHRLWFSRLWKYCRMNCQTCTLTSWSMNSYPLAVMTSGGSPYCCCCHEFQSGSSCMRPVCSRNLTTAAGGSSTSSGADPTRKCRTESQRFCVKVSSSLAVGGAPSPSIFPAEVALPPAAPRRADCGAASHGADRSEEREAWMAAPNSGVSLTTRSSSSSSSSSPPSMASASAPRQPPDRLDDAQPRHGGQRRVGLPPGRS